MGLLWLGRDGVKKCSVFIYCLPSLHLLLQIFCYCIAKDVYVWSQPLYITFVILWTSYCDAYIKISMRARIDDVTFAFIYCSFFHLCGYCSQDQHFDITKLYLILNIEVTYITNIAYHWGLYWPEMLDNRDFQLTLLNT